MKSNGLAIFIAGALTGALVTEHLLRKKYERIAREEIESVKQTLGGKKKEEAADDWNVTVCSEQKQEGKVDYTQFYKKDTEHAPERRHPYVISPIEFGSREDYMQVSLNLFSDGVLTDEDYEAVENVEGTVGSDSLNHFGEYEDDAVYVRNEGMMCDYEILKDNRTYAEVLKTIPHPTEGE